MALLIAFGALLVLALIIAAARIFEDKYGRRGPLGLGLSEWSKSRAPKRVNGTAKADDRPVESETDDQLLSAQADSQRRTSQRPDGSLSRN